MIPVRGVASWTFRWIPVICASALLFGCTSLNTEFDADASYIRQKASGVYFLPRTVFKVQSYIDAMTMKPMLSISKVVEADPATKLLFQIRNSALSDDVIEVKTDDAGLLTNVSSETTDHSGDIAVKLAELVFTTSTGEPLPSTIGRALPTEALSPDNSFNASYDPLDPHDVAAVRSGLPGYCIAVGEEALLPPSQACSRRSVQDYPPIHASPPVDSVGIYYRRPVSTPIRIYRVTKQGTKSYVPIFVGSEQIFDKSTLYEIAVDRAAFVKKVTTIEFTNGAVTHVKIDKPSEVLAGLNIPVRIAQIVAAIPLEGLKQDKALIDAQTNLDNSQVDLINAQKKLLNLQVGQAAATGRSLVINPVYPASISGRDLGLPASPATIAQCVSETGLTPVECRSRIQQGH